MIAAKVAVLDFDPAFLVPGARRAELRLKSPVRAERNEALGLLALIATQHFLHRTAQIVVAQYREGPAEISKRQLVRFEKRLLASVPIGAVKPRATGHTAHAKDKYLLPFAVDLGIGFVPVDLAFLPQAVRLRNKGLARKQSQRALALAHVRSHRRLRHRHLHELGAQSTPDAMRCVSLLARRFAIRLQNSVDKGHRGRQLRALAQRDLARPGYRVH